MCGPSIPGGLGRLPPGGGGVGIGTSRTGFQGRITGGGTLRPPVVEPAVDVELARKRQVKSGGRQSTILAGGGVARETRRKSLLAASNAEEQRKTLLGQ